LDLPSGCILKNIGGWSLLPVAAGKKGKFVLPMDIILKYI
jgi:hypothetical protein